MTIQIPDLGIEQRIEKFKLIKELDENRIEQNLEGNVVFHSGDYEVLRQETLQGKGIQSALAIEMCGEDEIQIDCNIGHNQGKFSLTNCTYEKKVFIKDPLDCIKDLEVNIFDYTSKTIAGSQGEVQFNFISNSKHIAFGLDEIPQVDFLANAMGGIPQQNGEGYFVYLVKINAVPYITNGNSEEETYGYKFHDCSILIQYIRILSDTQYSESWIPLISDPSKYYYNPNFNSNWKTTNIETIIYNDGGTIEDQPYISVRYQRGYNITNKLNQISNTVDLKELIEDVFSCVGLPLVSNFLGINNDSTNPNNEVYQYALENLQNLRIIQSYDVIREGALQDSFGQSGKLKVKRFLENFTQWLNLIIFHDTITDDLRIEHVSYLNAKGIDFVDQNIAYLLDENLEVNKDIIPSETWRMAAITPNGYETTITYDVLDRSQPKDYPIEIIITDIIGTANNPEFEQSEYQKLFYVVQTDGDNLIGFNTQLNINEVVKRLHYTNRVLPKGIHDGMNVEFSGYSLGLSGKLEYNGSLKDFRKLNPANSLVTRSGTFMIKKMEFSDSKIEFEIVK